ncbi:protein ADP-ribosylarginine hydrolase-like [Oncorhynchus mykiss]|nr:protein ADP-ribosylarginine hydrolase-like [Oncorhynchus mykiss]
MESLTEVIEHHPDLTMSDTVPLEQRYKASMVLSGAGDALGCNHGTWEFENDGVLIHEQVQKRGGLEKLDAIDFPVSDDTVMHLATAEALVKVGEGEGASLPVLYRALVEKYIVSMTDMAGRGAGDLRGSGTGSVDTHHALREGHPACGHRLMEVLDKAKEYVRHSGNCVELNMAHWDYFGIQWKSYLEKRGILDGKSKPQFPDFYGVKERESFYRAVSFKGCGGASGHDAPMIAYDALLRAGDSWVELANHGFFHGGDSDSTAVIAAAWWGALFGFRGVPEINYQRLEYRDRLSKLGERLYKLRGKHLGSLKE